MYTHVYYNLYYYKQYKSFVQGLQIKSLSLTPNTNVGVCGISFSNEVLIRVCVHGKVFIIIIII